MNESQDHASWWHCKNQYHSARAVSAILIIIMFFFLFIRWWGAILALCSRIGISVLFDIFVCNLIYQLDAEGNDDNDMKMIEADWLNWLYQVCFISYENKDLIFIYEKRKITMKMKCSIIKIYYQKQMDNWEL